MFHWILRRSSAVHKRLATSPAPFLRSPGSPPQHYHQASGTLYSLLGWQQDNGPLGPSETNRPCWAGGGGAILRPRELNTASVPLGQARRGQDVGAGGSGANWPWRQGPGQAAGLTWRVLRAGCGSRCGGGARAWTRPASAPGPGECAPPPSEHYGGGGAGADPCHPEPKENRAKVCREVLHSGWLCPASAYFLNISPTGSIDRSCLPSKGYRNAAELLHRHCVLQALVDCLPCSGCPPPDPWSP